VSMFEMNVLSSSSEHYLSPFTQKMSIESYSKTFGNRILTARCHTAKVVIFCFMQLKYLPRSSKQEVSSAAELTI
jgi:hypothetical protein